MTLSFGSEVGGTFERRPDFSKQLEVRNIVPFKVSQSEMWPFELFIYRTYTRFALPALPQLSISLPDHKDFPKIKKGGDGGKELF